MGFLIAFTIVSIPVSVTLYGWALKTMWGWFIAPTFDLPTLGLAVAVGIAATAKLFGGTGDYESQEKDSKTKLIQALVEAYLMPPIVVGFGWIILQFA